MTSPSTTSESAKSVFRNLQWECRYCHRPLKRKTVDLFGVPTVVPCWGSCGCNDSRYAGENVEPEDRRYVRAGIPPRYLKAECDLGDYLGSVHSGRSLYVHGPYGVGKTYFACALAKALSDMGDSVLFIGMPDLVSQVQASYGGQRTNVLDRAHGCDVLVLDDFGKEKVTQDTLQIAYLLVDGRYSSGRPTVVTSNFPRGGLASRMSAVDPETARAIASRLNEGTDVLEIAGRDRRLA